MFKNPTRCSSALTFDRTSFRRLFLIGIGIASFLAAPVHAQGYLPAPKGKATLEERNWLLPAQRSDLEMTFDHSFQGDPCPSPDTSEIIKTCTVTVELKWKDDGRWNQGEDSEKLGDPDDFVFHWEGFGHWSLDTATRDGNSVLGGSTPEGSGFGNGTVDGLSMTVPGSFESGKSDPITYEFVFSYVPGSECPVRPLKVSGHYIHKYEGSLRVWWNPSLSIAAGIPPSLGATAGLSFEVGYEQRAWQKQLFNPGGVDHKKTLQPPEKYVAHAGCCGGKYVTDPGSAEVNVYVTESIPAVSTTVEVNVVAINSPIQSVSVEAWTEDGINVGMLYHEPTSPTWDELVLDLTALIPAGSNPGQLHFVVVAREADLGQVQSIITAPSGGAPGPQFGGDAFDDETIASSGELLVLIDTDDPTDLMASSFMLVFDQDGNIADREAPRGIRQVAEGNALVFESMRSGIRTNGNGILEVQNHDSVQFLLEIDENPVSMAVPVLFATDGTTLNPFSPGLVSSDRIVLEGTCFGGRYEIDLGILDTPIMIETEPGQSAESVAHLLTEAINAHGMGQVTAWQDQANMIRLGGESGSFLIRNIDGGIDLSLELAAPLEPADFNGDDRVDGADLSMFLSEMASPTDDVRFDLNQDGIIDGADLAIMLGSWG
ncbi:MAG: hypothetical protein P8J45_10575 [Phycisphaerales bacterium]|nr:hypothetical protein [Phycisphaerales bacterium]